MGEGNASADEPLDSETFGHYPSEGDAEQGAYYQSPTEYGEEEAYPHEHGTQPPDSDADFQEGTQVASEQPPQQMSQPQRRQPAEFTTPFAQSEVSLPANSGGGGGKAALWAVFGAVGAIVVLALGFLAYRALQDPFRTLETFPTEKYLSNYESVLGNRFRVNLSVDAELGGTYDQGRILSFRDDATQRSLAIMVPPELSQTGFTKGQSYSAEIEVKQGGMIHAHAFKKN